MVHRESFLSSMKDLSQDSNTCSRSGDNKNVQYNQNGFSMRAPPPEESHFGNERDFLKQTMLQHEAVFKNQVPKQTLLSLSTQNGSVLILTFGLCVGS